MAYEVAAMLGALLHCLYWLYFAGFGSSYMYCTSGVLSFKLFSKSCSSVSVIQRLIVLYSVYTVIGSVVLFKIGFIYASQSSLVFWN